jgi:ribosome-binding protein aMBF1 (putative translation factor)
MNERKKETILTPAGMKSILTEWSEYTKDSARRSREKRREIGKRYGFAVKLNRSRRLLNQHEFAEKIGICFSYFAKIESGHILPSERVHFAIVDLLRAIPEAGYDRIRSFNSQHD